MGRAIIFCMKLATLAVILAASASAHAIDFGNWLPVGDSITHGWEPTGHGGYRGPLMDDLRANGHTITPVGSLTTNGWNLPVQDRPNEGHDGWSMQSITAGLPGWIAATNPGTITVMAGTNNTLDYNDAALTQSRVDLMVDTIFATDPSVTVFVGNIPNVSSVVSWKWAHDIHVANVDSAVRSAVARHWGLGHDIYFVDIHSVVDAETMMQSDGIHPDTIGYQAMAGAWKNAMVAAPEPSLMLALPALVLLRRRHA